MKTKQLLLAAVVVLFCQPFQPAQASGDLLFAVQVNGTYLATLADESQVFQLDTNGNIEQILSFQVEAGALGFTFTNSLGKWKRNGTNQASAKVVNFNFDNTPDFTGTAVVDYTLNFSNDFSSFQGFCSGFIYAPGVDPLDPSSSPIPGSDIDCDNLAGVDFKKIEL